MRILTKLNASRYALFIVIASTLTACGGGGSSSGGAPAEPPLPPFPIFNVGVYNGTINLAFEGENIVDSDDEPSPFRLEVSGSVAGSQQVRIAFRQFSGTSAILREGQFSIPSGEFPLRVRTRNNAVLTTCIGEFLFEGRFANSAVTGSVITASPFVCDDSRFGPITSSGTFEATLGSAKVRSSESQIMIIAEGF